MPDSIGQMFAESSKKFTQRTALKGRNKKALKETSYRDLSTLVEAFGAGLISIGVLPSDKLFVLSDNREEWLVADLAILSIGAVNVARGGDSTIAEVEYIVTHSDPKVVIVEDRAQLDKISSLQDRVSHIPHLILLEDKGSSDNEDTLHTYSKVIALGNELLQQEQDIFEKRLHQVKQSDLATIVYTSGTTGPPKGVMLTHANILSNVAEAVKVIKIVSDDLLLSILPSWHMFERTVEYIVLHQGGTLVYTNPRALRSDMATEKPTYMACVPRIWETFYERILRTIQEQNAFQKKLVSILLKAGKSYTLAARIVHRKHLRFTRKNPLKTFLETVIATIIWLTLKPAHWLGEVIVYRKLRQATGGCLKAAISGGGAFPAYLDDFFETVGITIINGYGLTETSPILNARMLEHNIRGSVGWPIPNTEVKVMDEQKNPVPDGEQGVLFVRGPQVMKGYYRDEKATRKVLTEDGWFNTGDLGRIAVTGDLAITGREKDTIVLLGGENVEPEPIETALKESSYIDNVMVVGQDKKYLSALIRPNAQMLSELFEEDGIHTEDILQKPLVNDLIKKEISSRINSANHFKPYEKIVKFILMEEDWTRENDLLTPTLKLKRNVITEKYRELIEKRLG